jgi:hypothetical protein
VILKNKGKRTTWEKENGINFANVFSFGCGKNQRETKVNSLKMPL